MFVRRRKLRRSFRRRLLVRAAGFRRRLHHGFACLSQCLFLSTIVAAAAHQEPPAASATHANTEMLNKQQLHQRLLVFGSVIAVCIGLLSLGGVYVSVKKKGKFEIWHFEIRQAMIFWKGKRLCAARTSTPSRSAAGTSTPSRSQNNYGLLEDDSAVAGAGGEDDYGFLEDDSAVAGAGGKDIEIQAMPIEPARQESLIKFWATKRADSNKQYLELRKVLLILVFAAYVGVSIAVPALSRGSVSCSNGLFWGQHMIFLGVFFATKAVELYFYATDPTLTGELSLFEFMLKYIPSFIAYADGYTDANAIVIASSCSDPFAQNLAFWMGVTYVVGVIIGQWCYIALLALRDPSQACFLKVIHMDTLAACTTLPEDQKSTWNRLHVARTIGEDIPQAFLQTLFLVYVKQNYFMVLSVCVGVLSSCKALYDAFYRSLEALGEYQKFLSEQGEDNTVFSEFYDIDKKKLGGGSYAIVSKATDKSTGAHRACKSISKVQMRNLDGFKKEIAIMQMMDHPNIVTLFKTFEDHRNIYLIVEFCDGGDLCDRICDAGHFTEVQAAILMKQIFRAVYYMHENKVCHRDLKSENFLFNNKDPIEKVLLKIVDFGLSCKFEDDTVMTTKAGTPYYVAPQVLAGKYDQLSDLWSCGVIMYIILCGYPPFYGETDGAVLTKVRLGNFSFKAGDWQNVSVDAKDLIKLLLKMNPRDRYTAEQSLDHVWVKNKAPSSNGDLQLSVVDGLRGLRSRNKLKKAALHIIAGQLGESQIKALRETFMALDGDGDGLLTLNEMKEGLAQAGLNHIPADLQQIMEEVDADGSGVIDYTEFLAATLDRKAYIQEDVCWSACRVFDRNGDGKISHSKIEQVLGSGDVEEAMGLQAVADLRKAIDANDEEEIGFEEFMQIMKAN